MSLAITTSIPHQINILLIGQLYVDTILHVHDFPEEDSKTRANYAEQRTGGNTCNTAKVLSQYKQLNVCYMSAAGSHDNSSHIIESLSNIQPSILYRNDALIPSSTIIHNEKTGSRTIISNNNLKELDVEEFKDMFCKLTGNHWWVHFEGRNIAETMSQIDWLNQNHHCVLSVEIEKPLRPDIELLIEKGDVVFFSKIFAKHHNYADAASFLTQSPLLQRLKPSAKAFCTWGSKGACAFDNETKQIYQASAPFVNKVIDTVGAGDTFNAGIILYLSLYPNANLQQALQFACQLASKKVAQQGFDSLKEKI